MRLWIIGGVWLAQIGFAQCPHVSHELGNASSSVVPALTGSAGAQLGVEDRTVLLKLVLSKSGGVREATVLRGAKRLAPSAIEAAKRQNYKRRIFPYAEEMTVAVTFRENGNGAPEIREAMSAGIPSCLPAEARRIDLPSWLNLWLSERPPIPALASETKK